MWEDFEDIEGVIRIRKSRWYPLDLYSIFQDDILVYLFFHIVFELKDMNLLTIL